MTHSNRFKIALFAVAALGLAGAAGAASPGRTGELVVEGLRAPGIDDSQRLVPFADLSLKTSEGQRALHRRVAFAIDSICLGGDHSISDPQFSRKCDNAAWANVTPVLEQLATTR